VDVWQLAISQLKCNVDFDLSCRVIEAQSAGERGQWAGRGLQLQSDFLLQLLTRNNCREPPQSAFPKIPAPPNVTLTSAFSSIFLAVAAVDFWRFRFR